MRLPDDFDEHAVAMLGAIRGMSTHTAGAALPPEEVAALIDALKKPSHLLPQLLHHLAGALDAGWAAFEITEDPDHELADWEHPPDPRANLAHAHTHLTRAAKNIAAAGLSLEQAQAALARRRHHGLRVVARDQGQGPDAAAHSAPVALPIEP